MSQSRKTFPHSAFSCILYFVFSCLYSVAKLQMMHSAIHTITIKTSKVLSLLFWDMSHSHSSLNGGSQKSSTNPSPGVHWMYRKDIVRWAYLWVGGCWKGVGETVLAGSLCRCVAHWAAAFPPIPPEGSPAFPLLFWSLRLTEPEHLDTATQEGLHALLLRLF